MFVGGAVQNEADIKLLEEVEGQLKELETIKEGGGLYELFSVMTDGVFKYKDVYEAAGGGNVHGWADKVQTMYGGAAFTEATQIEQVESFMNAQGPKIIDFLFGEATAEDSQTGGAGPEDNAKFLLEQMSKYVDPRMISLDAAVGFVLEFMDMMNEKTEDLSRQLGVIKLENTVHGVPLQEFGIPYEVPTRLLIVILQGIFEVLRLVSLFGFPGAGLLRMFGSVSGGLLEAAKGDWKSALFTFMGVMGSTAVVIGSFGKIVVKVMSLINTNTRNKLIYAGYESAKSLIIGAAVFIFTTFAPLSVKTMVDEYIAKLVEQLGGITDKQQTLMDLLQNHSDIQGKYELEFINFKNIQGLDFDSLQQLQDLFIIPEFYCNKAVQDFVEQMKLVPPARIILEFAGIPTTETFMKQSCMNVSEEAKKESGFNRSLLEALTPRLRPITPAAAQEPIIGQARAALASVFGKLSPKNVGASSAASMKSLTDVAGAFKAKKLSPERMAALKAEQEEREKTAARVRAQVGQAGKSVVGATTSAAQAATGAIGRQASQLSAAAIPPKRGLFGLRK